MSRLLRLGAGIYGVALIVAVSAVAGVSARGAGPTTIDLGTAASFALPAALFLLGFRRFAALVRI